ncbi:MAG: AAA family ATPase [Saprospiraceae bacterium]|nr:AAA family ATPase [Saprospiraceae bacterium]
MKILKIQFKNINNLKGENTISFEDVPLSSAGIFAITGPTGSGKSTILDVITLSLFNKIPRFRGAISKSSIEGLGSVITNHMSDAFASITFEIHNQVFTSSWSVGRTKSGKLKDYEMFIYDASGRPLDLKKSEVPGKNEQIIGLKYDQFVKSIILSQGQFSKFLKADKHERGQLLENLTGSSIYRRISMATYEKFKTVKDEVLIEKDRLDNIQVLSKEDRSNLADKIKENDVLNGRLTKEIETFTKAKQLKTDLATFSHSLARKVSEKEVLNSEINAHKDRLSQLNVYEKLNPILSDLIRYRDLKGREAQLSKGIGNGQKELNGVEDEKVIVVKQLEKLTGEATTSENFILVKNAFEKEVNTLVQEKKHIAHLGRETRTKINEKAKKHGIEIYEKASPSKTIAYLQGKLEEFKSILYTAGFESGANLDQINVRKKQFSDELEQLKHLQHAYDHARDLQKRKEKANIELLDYKNGESKYGPLVIASDKLVKEIRQNIQLLEKQQQDALLIAQLSDHRNQLVDGEPCPLCGSTNHPLAGHASNNDSELSKKILETKEKLEVEDNKRSTYHQNLVQSQASIKLLSDQMEALTTQYEKAKKEVAMRYNSYEGDLAKEEELIATSIQSIEEQIHQFESVATAVVNLRIITELIEEFDELNQIILKHQRISNELVQKYSGHDVSKDCHELQNKFVRANSQIDTLETLLRKQKAELEESKNEKLHLQETLQPAIEKLGFEDLEGALEFILSEEEIKQLRQKKEEFARRSTAVETELNSLQENIEILQKEDAMPSISLSEVQSNLSVKTIEKETVMRSIGEYHAILKKDDEEQKRLQSKELIIKNLEEKLEKWTMMNKLIGEKTGNKFANFAQGLTLQNLLVYANRRLQKLTDRYLLDKPIKDGALTVVDQYQGNIQRSVSTLSGGESFLISLALALSLSDMASKNVNLESLFIDEGFGTLDQESLDIVMNTLERLQTESQKTVGVISHVEALKERIHVQIKLDKNAQGYGTLKIVG